jgi:hypothetical protein
MNRFGHCLLLISSMFLSVSSLAATEVQSGALKGLIIRQPVICSKTARDFISIPNYFGNEKAEKGFKLVMTSDPEAKAGLYFIFTINRFAKSLPEGSQFLLEYVTTAMPQTQQKRFDIPKANRNFMYLGLTGTDVPAGSIIAWKISILDATNNVLASRQSSLF